MAETANPAGAMIALAIVATVPRADVASTPVSVTLLSASMVGDPTAIVDSWPAGITLALAIIATVPRADVASCPVTSTFASATATTVTSPRVAVTDPTVATALPLTPTPFTEAVASSPVKIIGRASPQAPSSQAPQPQPVILAI